MSRPGSLVERCTDLCAVPPLELCGAQLYVLRTLGFRGLYCCPPPFLVPHETAVHVGLSLRLNVTYSPQQQTGWGRSWCRPQPSAIWGWCVSLGRRLRRPTWKAVTGGTQEGWQQQDRPQTQRARNLQLRSMQSEAALHTAFRSSHPATRASSPA